MHIIYLFMIISMTSSIFGSDMPIQTYATVGSGVENYKWKMENSEDIQDCFTSAEWKKIHVAGLELGVKAYPFDGLCGHWLKNLWFNLHADWYFNVKRENFQGVFRESNIFGPSLTIETHRNGYRCGDIVIDVGYDLYLTSCFSIAYVIGLSAKKQHFKNHSGEVDIPQDLIDDIISLSLHKFHYETRWRDFWTGLQIDWNPNHCSEITLALNYHIGRFHGHGKWSIHESLTDGFLFYNQDKVRQNGTYQGVIGKVQAAYHIPWSCWSLLLDCKYRYFLKNHGNDHTKTYEAVTLEDGTLIAESYRKLNNTYTIHSQSLIVSFGVKYDF